MSKISTTVCCVVAIVVFQTAGCSSKLNVGKSARDTISAPEKWKISSDGGSFTNLKAAIDDTIDTMAVSGGNYRNTSFALDLGKPCVFNMIVLFHGKKEFGFAGKLLVSTSNDGKKYKNIHTAPGTRDRTYLLLMTPVNARYLRITALEAGSRPWSIGGIVLR